MSVQTKYHAGEEVIAHLNSGDYDGVIVGVYQWTELGLAYMVKIENHKGHHGAKPLEKVRLREYQITTKGT